MDYICTHFKNKGMKHIILTLLTLGFLNSCATKKELLYFQDAENYDNTAFSYSVPTIQPNDILRITVGSLELEPAIPYNPPIRNNGGQGGGIEVMQLEGYIVEKNNTINFPQLGTISTKDKTPLELQQHITNLLEDGGHLKNPNVNVRLLNAKVTILGEVNSPGVYSFTEQNITLLQALGYAGDLTINGQRENIMVLREVDNLRQVTHIDLTSAELVNSSFYQIKPNDVIIVDPNGPKIKSSGYITNLGSLLSVFSILLSTVILLTR